MYWGFLKKKRFWLFVLVAFVILLFHYFDFSEYFTVENLRYHANSVEFFVENYYWQSVLIFWGMYVFENIFGLPIAAWLTIAAGYFYGFVPAVFYTIVAATTGAFISFFMSRYFIGKTLQNRYKKQLKNFNEAFDRQGSYYLLSLRFIPVIPFVVVNVCAGLTLVSVYTFFWTTVIGMIPVTVLYALAGKQFHTISSVRDIFSWNVILLLGALVLLSLLPIFIKTFNGRLWTRNKKNN